MEPERTAGEGEITQLLAGVRGGDRAAMDRLFALVYDDLRERAHRRRWGRAGAAETLGTTALVHETYLKLVEPSGIELRDRAHFFNVAARAMRQILVDGARRRLAQKRGGGAPVELLDEGRVGLDARVEEVLALDDALSHLKGLDERLSRLVELRFFAGLSVEETAEAMELSPRTVKRDWRRARAFLHDALTPSPPA